MKYRKKVLAILTLLFGVAVLVVGFFAFSKKVPTGAVVVLAIITVSFSVLYSKIK